MSRILVLDTATKTGYCVIDSGVVIATGLMRLDHDVSKHVTGEFNRHPLILAAAERDFERAVEQWNPEWMVAEIPHLRGGSSFLTVAIYGVAQLVANRHGLGFYGVHTAQWQSRIVPAPKGTRPPKGDTKKRSIAHVRELGFDPETDDVADAICIAEYVHAELQIDGERLAVEPFGRAA